MGTVWPMLPGHKNFKMAANKRETENRINKYYSYVELLFFLLFMPIVNRGKK